MIRLTKGPIPQVLIDHAAQWAAVWVGHVENGDQIRDADKTRYRHETIKTAILQETFEKCAYCESKITQTYPGDIEHIFPKRRRPDLFVDWENLTLSCGFCNSNKGDYYNEDEPLLNPYVDAPEEHIRFHGALIFHVPGSMEGEITIRQLKLFRTALIERRTERIKAIKTLIDRWAAQPEGELKRLLLGEIQLEIGRDREYSFALRAFARDHAGIHN